MAKPRDNSETASAETQVMEQSAAASAPADAATGATSAPAKSGARVMLTNGEARIDFINRLLGEGKTKSEVTKAVNELSGGVKVPYQIIFAADKARKAKLAKAAATAAAPAPTEQPAPAAA